MHGRVYTVSAVQRIGNNAIRSRLGGKRRCNTVLHILVLCFVTLHCVINARHNDSKRRCNTVLNIPVEQKGTMILGVGDSVTPWSMI